MNNRVLFVDDEANVLFAYKRNLRGFFDVTTAETGTSALEILSNEPAFAVVVSDYRMPEMDGISFLHKVRELCPDSVRIILTGYADLQIAIDAINEGNIFRFLTKPIQNDKLVNVLKDSVEQYRLVTSEKELNQKLSDAYQTIRDDLEAAAELQRYFLPNNNTSVNDCGFNWLYEPSVYVSGDTFNYFKLDEQHLGFYIIDVAGHGLPAAMLSVSLSRAISPDIGQAVLVGSRASLGGKLKIFPPSKVVKELNDRFLSRGGNSEYFTMIYGVIDLAKNKIKFCQAGHPNPIILKKECKAEHIGKSGFPVGILSEAEFSDQEIDFNVGDKFYIYTDGITECAGVKHKFHITARLSDFLQDNRDIPSEILLVRLKEELEIWRNGYEFADDITMLAIERLEIQSELF